MRSAQTSRTSLGTLIYAGKNRCSSNVTSCADAPVDRTAVAAAPPKRRAMILLMFKVFLPGFFLLFHLVFLQTFRPYITSQPHRICGALIRTVCKPSMICQKFTGISFLQSTRVAFTVFQSCPTSIGRLLGCHLQDHANKVPPAPMPLVKYLAPMAPDKSYQRGG